MSQERQLSVDDDEEPGILVRSLGLGLPKGFRIEVHRHDWHQLVYATEGVMRVDTSLASWVVPPDRAVWISAGLEHSVQMTGPVRLQTIFLRPDLVPVAQPPCRVIGVQPLLRELVREVLRQGMLMVSNPKQERLVGVLLDQILDTRALPAQIRLPTDRRARAVAERVQANLAMVLPLQELVRDRGVSARTIERSFLRETGLTFGRWVQRVRALHAVWRLADGCSVAEAGLEVGYDSTSAFIAMFRRVLGRTPGTYLRD